MSLSAAVIDALVAAGATAEQLAAAMKADLAEAEQRLIEKRAKDAERQRRHRKSRDVTVTDRDTALVADDNSDPSLDGSPPPPLLQPNQKDPPLSPRKRKTVEFPEPPAWMPPDPWAAMVALRQDMHPKVRWTPAAATRLIAEVDKQRSLGHCPTKLLDKAVLNSWRTVYPADDTKATNGNGKHPQPLTNEELKRAIQFNEDQGNLDRAKAYRFQLEARQSLAGHQ